MSEKEIDYKEFLSIRHKYNDELFISSSLTSKSAKGVCQRKSGETQSECEDREYDEFVEDCFVCWVAYWTNPPVPLLISALCLCQESK